MKAPLAAAGALALALATTMIAAALEPFATARELLLARWTGYTALILLGVSLSVSPLARRLPRAVALRRTFGLAAAAAALIHAMITLATGLAPEWSLLVLEPHLRSGFAALIVLAILAATSFPRVLRVERWRSLHRLVYPAAILALHHAALSSHAAPWILAAAAATAILLAAARIGR